MPSSPQQQQRQVLAAPAAAISPQKRPQRSVPAPGQLMSLTLELCEGGLVTG